MASPSFVTPNGKGTAGANFASSFTVSNAFTALQAGDMIYIAASTDSASITITGISGSGLTFAQRLPAQFTNVGEPASLCSWSAIVPSPMTGFSVVCTLTSSVDGVAANWFVVRGPGGFVGFDPHPGLPFFQTGAPPSAVTYSTTDADDLLVFYAAGDNGMWIPPGTGSPPSGPTVTPSPPWAYLVSDGNSGGFGFSAVTTYEQSVSAPQTAQTVNSAISFSDGAIFVVDAFTSDSPPSVGAPFLIKPKRYV
jgi:hypothetical protein